MLIFKLDVANRSCFNSWIRLTWYVLEQDRKRTFVPNGTGEAFHALLVRYLADGELELSCLHDAFQPFNIPCHSNRTIALAICRPVYSHGMDSFSPWGYKCLQYINVFRSCFRPSSLRNALSLPDPRGSSTRVYCRQKSQPR